MPINLLKIGQRYDTSRLPTMISKDGRMREKSNVKVATNESCPKQKKKNKLSFRKTVNSTRQSHYKKLLKNFTAKIKI